MMSKINQTDIDRLIELVGGRGNIATVSHCITGLRFVLNQPANARPKEIEQLPMVKGCFTNAGQFQVVIGTNVGDYYQALIASTGQAQVDKEQVHSGKGSRQSHQRGIQHTEDTCHIAGQQKQNSILYIPVYISSIHHRLNDGRKIII